MASSKIDLKHYEIPGCVLVFNHNIFVKELKLENRKGTEIDEKNLKESFEDTYKCEFKFRVYNDLTYDKIAKTLKNYADPNNPDRDHEWVDLSKCGCLVIVVLTHGQQGGMVCAKDSLYHISRIWEPFIDCKALKNKLLWLVFQACRTNQGNVELVETQEKFIEMGKFYKFTERTNPRHADVLLPRRPNTLVFFGTVEHRGANREDKGTWFISKLCNEVRNWSADYGLLAMVKRVTSNVVELGLGLKIGQTPTCVSFLTSDVFNSVQKSTIPNRAKNVEGNSTTGSNADSTAPYLITDSSESSSSGNKPVLFDTNLIDSDAGSGKVNNEMPRYVWNTQYAGRAYIFYDSHHEEEAKLLASIAEDKMGLRAIQEEISTTVEVTQEIKRLALQDNFGDESCLLVVVLAELCEKKNLEEVCPAITRAFLSTACTTLAAKPKLFFFFDKDIEENLTENPIVSDSPGEKLNFASQHSDMIFVRAKSQELLSNFLTQLECRCQREDLMQIFTNSIGRPHPCNKMLPHLESTLLCDLIFPPQPKKLLNLEDLDGESKGPVFEDPCINFVGRTRELHELNDYFNGANQNKTTAKVAAISGPIGSGKTQLVRKLKQEFESELPFQTWILIEPRKENEQIKELLLSSLSKSKPLVVFEDFEPSNTQDLSSLSNLNIIILSREDCSHIAIAQKHIKLGGLEDEDAKELCKNIYEDETDEYLLKQFASTFHNHPLALDIMCKFTKNRAEDVELLGETYNYTDALNEFKDNKYCMFITEDAEDQQIIETDDYGKLSREEWDEICKENGF